MLDSLVRVSRRVGWNADRLATDPETRPAVPIRHGGAVGRHGCPVPASRTPPRGQAATRRAAVPRSRQRLTSTGRSTTVRSCHASDRACRHRETGRSALPAESARGGGQANQGRVRRSQDLDEPNPPHTLNSAGRLCGSTRLPLGGFTYS